MLFPLAIRLLALSRLGFVLDRPEVKPKLRKGGGYVQEIL